MTNITFNNKTQIGKETPLFISKWDTTLVFDDVGDRVDPPNSPDNTIVLPLTSDGSYDFYVDWGDGNRDNITAYNQSEVTHQYSNTGIYEIRIRGGITGWQFNGVGDDDKILEISNWGPLSFVSDDIRIFNGCSNLEVTATDSPIFSSPNTNMVLMFSDCFNLGSGSNMSNWNTSNITLMSQTFEFATTFNKVLDNWDTSNVTGMYRMFGYCTSFNNGGSTGINNWNISNVTNISSMLQECDAFDQDLSNWIVTGITSATSFMQNANGLSTTNYDRTLSGWSSQAVQNGVNIHFGGSQYSTATGAAYRSALVASGWTITDGGAV